MLLWMVPSGAAGAAMGAGGQQGMGVGPGSDEGSRLETNTAFGDVGKAVSADACVDGEFWQLPCAC